MTCGVYAIINRHNGKIYIGSSNRIEERRKDHFRMLREKKHPNYLLQNSFKKHGKDTFEFKVIEQCKEEHLRSREQYYINYYNATNPHCGYNISLDAAAPMRGRRWTEKQRQANEKRKGIPLSEEAKRKMSIAHKGKRLGNGLNVSTEEREKRRERMRLLNQSLTPAQRAKGIERQVETKNQKALEKGMLEEEKLTYRRIKRQKGILERLREIVKNFNKKIPRQYITGKATEARRIKRLFPVKIQLLIAKKIKEMVKDIKKFSREEVKQKRLNQKKIERVFSRLKREKLERVKFIKSKREREILLLKREEKTLPKEPLSKITRKNYLAELREKWIQEAINNYEIRR